MLTTRISSDEDHQRFESFVSALFSSRRITSIKAALSDLTVPSPYRIRTKVVYSQDSPSEAFGSLAARGAFERLRDTGPGFHFSVPRAQDDGMIAGAFCVLPTKHRSVSVVISVTRRNEWLTLLRLIRRQYPVIVPVLLSQKELISGVLDLREREKDFQLRVRELSGLEPVEHSPGSTRSVREWTDEGLREALAHVARRRQIIKSLKLGYYHIIDGHSNVTPSVEAKITRRGEVEVSGRFAIAWDSVIAYFATVGHQKLEFLSRRGLRDRGYRAAPIQIAFGADVLSESAEVRRLVDVLKSYPHAMFAVQHGNPYAHVLLTDVYDGSGFDVWSLTASSVVVVPRLKATAAAYERLIHHIFDKFQEGEIREYTDA